MKNIFFIALYITSVVSMDVTASKSEYTFFVNGYSDNYTPSVPVVDFSGSWKGAKTFERADVAYTNNLFQIGVANSTYSFAAVYRYDYALSMNPDVSEYRFNRHNSIKENLDRDFIADLHEQRLTTYGFRLGYTYDRQANWSVTTYLNVLQSNKFQDRLIYDGTIHGITQLGNASANYHFDEDTLYKFLDVESAPSGYGGSLDIDFTYFLTPDSALIVNIKDLFHFITFKNSPYAIGEFNVNQMYYDESDVLQQTPAVNFQTHESAEGGHQFTQHMPTRVAVTYEQRFFEHYTAKLIYKSNEIFNSMALMGAWNITPDANVAVSYNIDTQAVGLHTEYHNFYIDILSDNTDYSYANSLSLFVGLSWGF
ncbi:hypothetical protein [Flocculibacter collagenilyticus]|uniref:hypothetical protein n=1 Tax=Flocculibacter collagenilyticus TaxID=2744479 RepID=UPI0018F3C73D|nr:hypothetical protein [Flocculibacter collagenilyticus]